MAALLTRLLISTPAAVRPPAPPAAPAVTVAAPVAVRPPAPAAADAVMVAAPALVRVLIAPLNRTVRPVLIAAAGLGAALGRLVGGGVVGGGVAGAALPWSGPVGGAGAPVGKAKATTRPMLRCT